MVRERGRWEEKDLRGGILGAVRDRGELLELLQPDLLAVVGGEDLAGLVVGDDVGQAVEGGLCGLLAKARMKREPTFSSANRRRTSEDSAGSRIEAFSGVEGSNEETENKSSES